MEKLALWVGVDSLHFKRQSFCLAVLGINQGPLVQGPVRLPLSYRFTNEPIFKIGFTEMIIPGALVGETFGHIIGEQFKRLKYGDRFWYESGTQTGFSTGKYPYSFYITLVGTYVPESEYSCLTLHPIRTA